MAPAIHRLNRTQNQSLSFRQTAEERAFPYPNAANPYPNAIDPPEGWDQTREWLNRRTLRTYQVPVGVDPGFQFNVGMVDRSPNVGELLVGRIDAADPDLARAAIGEPWKAQAFRLHAAGKWEGDWPVAVVEERLMLGLRREMGARSRTVRLSGETAQKQAERHPDLSAEDYARVQRILDRGELFREGERKVMDYLVEDGRPWRAVVKVTEDGSQVFLETLHKARNRNLRSGRRRYSSIERD